MFVGCAFSSSMVLLEISLETCTVHSHCISMVAAVYAVHMQN
jgi:hypothetical protein